MFLLWGEELHQFIYTYYIVMPKAYPYCISYSFVDHKAPWKPYPNNTILQYNLTTLYFKTIMIIRPLNLVPKCGFCVILNLYFKTTHRIRLTY